MRNSRKLTLRLYNVPYTRTVYYGLYINYTQDIRWQTCPNIDAKAVRNAKFIIYERQSQVSINRI